MIKVMIVDDSPTARTLFRHIISSEADMRVIAEAGNGEEAVTLVQKHRPDVILMDAIMPRLDGVDATQQIMEVAPTPIVIISSAANNSEANLAFRAIRAGALTVLNKPRGIGHADFERDSRQIVRQLRAMSQVHVIHHRPKREAIPTVQALDNNATPKIVGIVSSTGGPGILSRIFEPLYPNYPLPIVVVQHIGTDFIYSLVKWLDTVSPLPVHIATQGTYLEAGHVYIAPTGQHLRVTSHHRMDLSLEPTSLYTPSGDILLESIAASYGKHAVGIILTGMGEDGVVGMGAMKRRGAMTIAQDEATAVVYGMPKAAIEQNVAQQSLSPAAIAGYLNSLVKLPT